MRVSTSMIYSRFIQDLQSNTGSLFKDYERISTGRKLTRPSDDPVAISSIISGKAQMISIEAYNEGINTGNLLLNASSTALGGLSDLIDSAKGIGTNASSNLDASGRATYASLLQNIIDSAIGIGNTKIGDRYIFSGYSTDQPAIDAATGMFQGTSDRIAVAVNAGISIDVNITADELITSGPALATAPDSGLSTAAGGFTSPADVFSSNGGSLDLSVGGGPVTTIGITAGATLTDVRDAINAAGSGIRADVVNTNLNGSPADYRLVLSAAPADNAAAISVSVTTADGVGTGLNLLDSTAMAAVVSPDMTIIGALGMLKTSIEQGDQTGIERAVTALRNLSTRVADKQSDIGIRLKRLEDERTFLKDYDKNITDQVSSELMLSDVEIAELITQARMKETSLQALRSISAEVLQTNLFDFLE